MKRRSIGLILVCVFLIISALPFVSYVRPLFSGEFRDAMREVMRMDYNMTFTPTAYVMLCVWGMVGAACRFISACLALALKEAGRKLAILTSLATILVTIGWSTYHMVVGNNLSIIAISTVIFLTFNVFFIFFFTRPKVKEQFV